MKHCTTALVICLLGLNAASGQEPFVISQVDEGLLRGRAPRRRSEFEELRQAGVRSILDTRAFRPFSSRHEARLAAEFGIRYYHYRYPALPWAVQEAEPAYQEMLRLQRERGPLFVHCQQNRDRTSLLIGLYRVRVQGWAPAAAYEEMQRFGLRSYLPYFERYFWANAYGPGMPASH